MNKINPSLLPTYGNNSKETMISVDRKNNIKDIRRIRKQMQRIGYCYCSQRYLVLCDANCAICQFRNKDFFLSLDAPLVDNNSFCLKDTLVDNSPTPEEYAIKKELSEQLCTIYDSLNTYERFLISTVVYSSFRKASDFSEISSSKLQRDWKALRETLADRLHDYYY